MVDIPSVTLFRQLELVADFPDCVDECWVVRVGFDFVSQSSDESVDTA